MTPLDWILLAGYFVLLILIGVQTMRRVKNPDDFAVAGNRIVWPVLFGSLAAAFLGGGASIGIAGASMRDGYVYMFAFCAFGIQTVLVGLFVAPRLKNYVDAHTLGDVMHEHYGKPARVVTGVLSVALCAGILGAQALAIGTVVNATLHVPRVPAVLIGMGVVILYSSFGGAWAVIQTDMLQFVFLGVLLPVALLIGLNAVGGPNSLIDQVPAAHLTVLGDYTPLQFLTLFCAFLLGETLVPPYAQRTFSTPDSRHARIGFTMAGLFSFFFYFTSASLGLIALVLYPNIKTDEALPTVVVNLMPIGVLGLVIAALLAVVMSTASSYLNSTAVVLTKDIYQPLKASPISSSAQTDHRTRYQRDRGRRCHDIRAERALHRRCAALQLYALGADHHRPTLRSRAVRNPFCAGGAGGDRSGRRCHRRMAMGACQRPSVSMTDSSPACWPT